MFLSSSNFFQVFTIAPDDGNNATERELGTPRLALAVRIHPIDTNGPPMCLRVGVYGTRGMDRAIVYYGERRLRVTNPYITARERSVPCTGLRENPPQGPYVKYAKDDGNSNGNGNGNENAKKKWFKVDELSFHARPC